MSEESRIYIDAKVKDLQFAAVHGFKPGFKKMYSELAGALDCMVYMGNMTSDERKQLNERIDEICEKYNMY